jgi:hypothetical protein
VKRRAQREQRLRVGGLHRHPDKTLLGNGAFDLRIGLMVMTAGAMHVAVFELFGRGLAHADDLYVEV